MKRQNGTDEMTIRRLVLWVAQGLTLAVCAWIYTEIKDVKLDNARIAAVQATNGERFALLEAKAQRYGEDIAEIKVLLRQIGADLSQQRVEAERRQSRRDR